MSRYYRENFRDYSSEEDEETFTNHSRFRREDYEDDPSPEDYDNPTRSSHTSERDLPQNPSRAPTRKDHVTQAPPSLGLSDSISSITEELTEVTIPTEVTDIYLEMQDINFKMKKEFKVLHERDIVLKEKEKLLSQREQALSVDKANFEKMVVEEVKRRLAFREQEHKTDLEKMDMQLKEKTRENKRLKENFDTLKIANDTLRKELDSLKKQHDKLEKQSTSLQARLTNLQRKQQHTERKELEYLPADLLKKKQQKASKDAKALKGAAKPCLGTYDVLALLLEWVSDVHLRHITTDQPSKPGDGFTSKEFVQEKCFKILPSLVEIIRDVPSTNQRIVLPCLQFIYWALTLLEHLQPVQKTSMTSTLRRLGEELYKPRSVRFSEEEKTSSSDLVCPSSPPGKLDKSKEGAFFRSTNLHIRFLSSLVILRTLTQVDLVAHIFEVLRGDLKTETAKELFLHYQATPVLIPFLRPANKALTNYVVDIYLQMSMESSILPTFLDSCSTESWFRASSMVFRMPGVEEKLVEKFSIILQKLSKIKSNKKYFEVFGITSTAQEMVRTMGSENAFLTLNLKSILFNLSAKSVNFTTANSSISSSH